MTNHNAISSVIESVEFRPAREDVYPAGANIARDMDLPPDYKPEATVYDQAIAYARGILPGVDFQPLSNSGRTAVILHDGQHAYKVIRERGRGYDRVEDEVAALQVLSNEGIAPRPLALIDATRQHRYAYRQNGQAKPLFGGKIEIPRFEGSGHLPIIVTELQDVGPITELPNQKLGIEFSRFALAGLRHNLLYEDCQFMYDRRRDRAIVLDVGEVRHPAEWAVAEDDDGLGNAEIVRSAMIRFGNSSRAWPELEALAAGSFPDKLGELQPILHDYCEA